MMQTHELAPAGSSTLEAFELALVQLREALTSADLTELNEANDALKAAVQNVQPHLIIPERLNAQSGMARPLEHIQREIRIAGELLVRANAANRRALSVFATEPGSYGPHGL